MELDFTSGLSKVSMVRAKLLPATMYADMAKLFTKRLLNALGKLVPMKIAPPAISNGCLLPLLPTELNQIQISAQKYLVLIFRINLVLFIFFYLTHLH